MLLSHGCPCTDDALVEAASRKNWDAMMLVMSVKGCGSDGRQMKKRKSREYYFYLRQERGKEREVTELRPRGLRNLKTSRHMNKLSFDSNLTKHSLPAVYVCKSLYVSGARCI